MRRQVWRVAGSVMLAAVLVPLAAVPVGAAPGDRDASFGDDGVAVVFAGPENSNSEATAVAVDPAGHTVVAGNAPPFAGVDDPPEFSVFVTRLTPAGVPDPSFGTGGSTTLVLDGWPGASAVAVQPDRSVLLLASAQAMNDDLVVTEAHSYVVRLKPDGTRDTSFGTDGQVEIQPAGHAYGNTIAVAPGGAILVAGGAWPGTAGPPNPFVTRLTPGGAHDASFGTGGVASLVGPGVGQAVAVAPDGRIVVGVGFESWMGVAWSDGWSGYRSTFTVRRLTPGGAVDTSFATGGSMESPLPGEAWVRSLLPTADGSLIVIGAIGRHPFVAKLTAAGALDTTFGAGGLVEIAVPGGVHSDRISGALLPDGKVLVGGPGGPAHAFLARLLPAGWPDRTFGAGGRAGPAPAPFPVQTVAGPAVQTDGAAVFAGLANGVTLPDGSPSGDQMAAFRLEGGSVPAVPPADTATRIAGADRVATAVAASQATYAEWMKPDGVRLGASGSAVIASADSFADALVAAPFAAVAHLPLLLTPGRALDPRVLAELQRVAGDGSTGGVAVVGGPAAVSDEVVDALAAAGYEVERIAGANRYETAVQVAEFNAAGIVFEATGHDFADAVVAGAAAAQVGGAVLLTDGATQAQETADYVERMHPVRYAVGAAAAAADPAATSFAGADRYDTAVKVAAAFFPTPSSAAVATGADFPDALVAAARAALLGAPVLLTHASALPAPADAWLRGAASWLDTAEVFGGIAAVGEDVVTAIDAAITATPPPNSA